MWRKLRFRLACWLLPKQPSTISFMAFECLMWLFHRREDTDRIQMNCVCDEGRYGVTFEQILPDSEKISFMCNICTFRWTPAEHGPQGTGLDCPSCGSRDIAVQPAT